MPIRAQHRVRLGVQEGPEPDLARPHRRGLGHLTLGIGQGRDGLLALDGPRGQRAEQLDQRDVVLQEERPPGQARLEETDPRILRAERDGQAVRRIRRGRFPDRDEARGRVGLGVGGHGLDPVVGRDPDLRGSQDAAGHAGERAPQDPRLGARRAGDDGADEVERQRPIAHLAQPARRRERRQVADAGHERQQPGEDRDGRVARAAGPARRAGQARDHDRRAEQDRCQPRRRQPDLGEADPAPSLTDQQDRGDELGGGEVEHEEQDRRCAPAGAVEGDDREHEATDRRRHGPPSERHDQSDEAEHERRLRHEEHDRERAEERRQ